ncbi:Uma2 family endonuclease [Streptomyces sp. V4I23]|uniref:Uma2 family endonuclease n=1 Tax=Streptomyces sp. V4I23 TaxID=3042282 RepID=UPI002789E921|nr:Uma2 family endonuclease [Streptomyces sp. V4I23]MDQ1009878.1 Uma2 family endonuclease [Streptomyces sp. V4I23]
MSEAHAYAWQYGGGVAERDTGPPPGPAHAAEEPEPQGWRPSTMSVQPPMRPRPRPGNLRELAETIESATGLRVQIVGGSLVMSPTPRGKHAGVIYRLEETIRPRLPKSLVAVEMASIEMPEDPDDYVTPDLTVCPAEFLTSDHWLIDPHDVELAVEVISQSEKARDIRQKSDWYAVAGVRALLVVDPRHGTWALHTSPSNGSYQDTLPGKYGEEIPLPDPLALSVATGELPLYGDGGSARPR